MAPQSPNIPNSNNSNVDQSSSAFNFQIPPSVSGSIGALSSLYSSYGQFQQGNPVLGSLSFGASIPYLQQAFPNTFDPNSYQDQGSKDLINGLNKGGQFAQGGLSAYGIYSNLQNGNYLNAGLDAQKLTALGQQAGYIPDFTQNIQNATGLSPVQYGDARSPTSGFAPYATAPIGAYNAAQNFKDGNYLGGTINAAQSIQASAQIYNTYFPAAQEISKTLLSSGGVNPAASAGNLGFGSNMDAAGNITTDIGSVGANAAGSSTLDTLGEYAGYAGVAYAAYNAGKTLFDDNAPPEARAKETRQQVENAAASYYTLGLSSLAQFADAKLFGGAGEKFRDKYEYYANPGALISDKVLGGVIKATGSGKGERQQVRDGFRDVVKNDPQLKLFDEKYQGTLADGSPVDFGKDKFSFDEGGTGEQNIDLSTEEGKDAAAFGDSIGAAYGLSGKKREAIATLFAGNALKNAKGKPQVAAANMNHFMSQLGLDRGKAQSLLNQNVRDKKISKDDYAAFSATLNRLGKGGDPKIRQLSPEEIDEAVNAKEKDKILDKGGIIGTDPKTGKPIDVDGPNSNLPIDYNDTDGKPDTGKRLPTAAEKNATPRPIFNKTGGKTTLAPDGVNKIITYPDGTSMTTLIYVVKPSDKIAGNLQSGNPPSTNLSKDDLKKLWTDAAKSGINFRRA